MTDKKKSIFSAIIKAIKTKCVEYSLIGISIVSSGIAICCYISDTVVTNNESVVLIFVGILVTIIVLGNVAQVNAIKKEMEKEIQKVKERQDMIDEIATIVVNFYDNIQSKPKTQKTEKDG